MKASDPNLLMCHPTWFMQTYEDLKRHEGFREYAYPDPLSYLAKLHRKENWGNEPARGIIARVGGREIDGRPWTVGYGFTAGVNVDSRMTVFQADRKLEELVGKIPNDLNDLLPEWINLPVFAQSVLANMDYNLGKYKLSKFAPTLQLFKEKKFAEAGERLTRSLWYSQVGARGKELVARLETGRIESAHDVTRLT